MAVPEDGRTCFCFCLLRAVDKASVCIHVVVSHCLDDACDDVIVTQMTDDSSPTSAAEFLSRCWLPIIHLESRFMFAYGNTLMEDFLEDLQVSDVMDILMLGVGDIRYMLKTVAGLEGRPKAARCPQSLR